MQFYNKWREFLTEAPKDAKVLRNINIDHLKKEIPKNPDEEIRDYFARLQGIEADPEQFNPVFPHELVSWIESLPDNHFPTNGRKRFAKWLGNSIYFEETDADGAPFSANAFKDLNTYNNDVRYITDYLNGATDFPKDLWDLKFYDMASEAENWHLELKGIVATGAYETKEVVYSFDSGFTIVKVPSQDLETEGEFMGHCVGSYCDHVSSGAVEIYSLRNRKNEPHATIEITRDGKVYQIKGKGNAAPVEKYRPMIKQWLQTTDFEYKNSPDYLNIMSRDEIRDELFSGRMTLSRQLNMARETDDQEVLDFFLDKIEDKLDMEDDPEPYGSDAKRNFIQALARNHSMNEETRIRLLKINLPRQVLGLQVGQVLGTGFSRFPETVELRRLNASAWEALGSEVLSSPISDEKLFYMKVFVEGIETDQSIKEEIIDRIITVDYIEEMIKNKGLMRNASLPYGQIIQEYLQSKSPSEEAVSKIYYMQRYDPFVLLLGQVGRLNRYISNSRGMSDKLVDAMIDDIEDNRFWQMGVNDMMDVIRNKKVSDSNKIKILNQERPPSGQTIRMHVTPVGPRGVKFTPRGKSVSRHLKQAADEGLFTEKFAKYLVDEGFLDPIFADTLRGKKVLATGKDPMFDKAEGEEKEAIMRDVRQMAEEWLNSPKEKAPWVKDQLQEEVDKYFDKNISTKDKFYSTIKEEAGRSRQRGIYKFHCMISYGLTTEEGKSRGLDDILADMRALENVTIVTVAIRNQKVAEGRYIAGLAIKFIPSVPGQFNSPEDVKARIVRDIKRLANVQTLFKLSAGLNRLE
tara:strand:- start:2751 stop:5162 length:2412 start_codon:yes stop_codon:yes gene_type:complete